MTDPTRGPVGRPGYYTPHRPAFDVTRYRPAPGATVGGVLLMASAGLLAAGILGAVASAIGQVIYFIFIFPIVIGLGVGFTMAGAAGVTKMHNPLLAGLLGLWCGAVAMLTVHYCDYQWALADRPGFIRLAFPEFMQIRASAGVKIGKPGGGGRNLGHDGTVAYWAVEAAVVAGLVFAVCRKQSGSPFCRRCDEWKKAEFHGPFTDIPSVAAERVRAGEIARVGVGGSGPAVLALEVAVCPRCGENGAVDVKLLELRPGKNHEPTKDVLCHVTYPGEALTLIRALGGPRTG